MADVEAMFHQVKIPERDMDCLRFYWWPNGNLDNQPEVYRMTAHLFGAVSSPSCSNTALRKTAEDNSDRFKPEVSDVLVNNFYVDDCLKSCRTETEAISLVQNLISICQLGGFNLTKWISNSYTVLETVPVEKRAKDVKQLQLGCDDLPTQRALGVYWAVESDVLGFNIDIQNRPSTRRGILSVISSIYDPLGLAAPFILPGKIILQDLCHRGTGLG
ncbi:uncharacterized protein LOC102807396 [Saccoglossus kowalevskii]|uniref:Uncharacterized protein LOC102807396 n=1 Tax=Saccoglossus kowalevskii TaxID=10224 RepID=A0ABM0MAH6_SACKO|nr:PREDICTED: uncharacterized protein LOC102807396 [Saccoglossus kowalevskii]